MNKLILHKNFKFHLVYIISILPFLGIIYFPIFIILSLPCSITGFIYLRKIDNNNVDDHIYLLNLMAYLFQCVEFGVSILLILFVVLKS